MWNSYFLLPVDSFIPFDARESAQSSKYPGPISLEASVRAFTLAST